MDFTEAWKRLEASQDTFVKVGERLERDRKDPKTLADLALAKAQMTFCNNRVIKVQQS